jgi:prevent-host-death family protein
MYVTRGIEAVATVTELRSQTSSLIEQTKGLKTGIMIQKNNEPEAVLLSYERYLELYNAMEKQAKKK